MARLFWHWAILMIGLYLITFITPISYDAPKDLAWAAFVLIIANTILKPVLILISLPLVLLSFGLFLFVINALVLYSVPHFVPGFHVPGFWSAFFGAILLSLITGFFSRSERRVTVRRVATPARTSISQGTSGTSSTSGRVIDI